jgi:hypothetical protein
MNQRPILLFLHLKGLSANAKDVRIVIVQLLGSDAFAYSTVTNYLQKDVILQNEPETEDRAEDQGFSIADNAILEALEMLPFPSIHELAKITIIAPATVFHRLTKSFHFILKQIC